MVGLQTLSRKMRQPRAGAQRAAKPLSAPMVRQIRAMMQNSVFMLSVPPNCSNAAKINLADLSRLRRNSRLRPLKQRVSSAKARLAVAQSGNKIPITHA